MSLRTRDRLSVFFALFLLFFAFGLAASWAVALARPILNPDEAQTLGAVPPAATESLDAARAGHLQPTPRSIIPASLPPGPSAQDPQKFTGTPRIAIIIDDMGLNATYSARAAALDAPLTLSYLPYAHNVQDQVDRARAAGHEIMLHLPMEPLDRHLSAGPGALTTALSPDEFQTRLMDNLTAFRGYVGVNNHMGSRLTGNAQAMERVMQALVIEDVYFVDSWTSGRSVAYHAAAAAGLPRARRDVFLDHDMGTAAVWRAVRQAEYMAARTGQAVLIGHPRPDTLSVLRAWLPDVQARGVKIVPMSDLLYDGDLAGDPVLRRDGRRQARVSE